jgi:hypothetical protein
MLVATVFLMFAPIMKVATGHLREAIFGGKDDEEKRGSGWSGWVVEGLAKMLVDN